MPKAPSVTGSKPSEVGLGSTYFVLENRLPTLAYKSRRHILAKPTKILIVEAECMVQNDPVLSCSASGVYTSRAHACQPPIPL
jgi:hypothetical protein